MLMTLSQPRATKRAFYITLLPVSFLIVVLASSANAETKSLTPASASDSQPSQSQTRSSTVSSHEMSQLEQLIMTQNKAIEELRAKLEQQQALIDRLVGTVQGQGNTSASSGRQAPVTAEAALRPGNASSASITSGQAAQAPSNGPTQAKIIEIPASPATTEKSAEPLARPPAAALIEAKSKAESRSPTRRWFEKYSLRGYVQFRYNRLLETNPLLSCEQCDRSWGGNNGFLTRRARLILSGDINDRVYMYFQPDFASSAGSTTHYGQLRDLYFDVALDKKKEFRIRVGQSKIPFGFENLQSSQNRPSLDRNDSLNSAVANERDLAAFFYWAPAHVRKRFSHLVSSGLKGSGDYGVFGAGLYNGQTANRPDINNNLHTVARLTYPFELKNGQFVEVGVAGYTGQYSVGREQRSPATQGPEIFQDRRVAGSLTIYPQPFGFQAEYNVGRGPMFNSEASRIENHGLQGGYGQFLYMARFRGHILSPYVKVGYYDGGKKHELDARRYLVREQEFGLEWQPNPFIELTTAYTHSDRTFEDQRLPDNRQRGSLLRIQLQFNY